MTKRPVAAAAAMLLLCACDVQGGGETQPEERSAAAATNAAEANLAAEPAAPLGEPISGEQAKTLMHDRHEGMEEIGDAMKLVTQQLRGDRPDLERVRAGAATIARMAPQVTGWFPPGTGPDVGKTEAKAEIWQKPEDFVAKRNTFQQAAQAFNAAAQGSDLAAIRAAHAQLAKTCKACHDPYREEH